RAAEERQRQARPQAGAGALLAGSGTARELTRELTPELKPEPTRDPPPTTPRNDTMFEYLTNPVLVETRAAIRRFIDEELRPMERELGLGSEDPWPKEVLRRVWR